MDRDLTDAYLQSLSQFATSIARSSHRFERFANALMALNSDIKRVLGKRRSAVIEIPCINLQSNHVDVGGPKGVLDVFIAGTLTVENGCLQKQDINVTLALCPTKKAERCSGRPEMHPGTYYVLRRMHVDYDVSNSSVQGCGQRKNGRGEHGSVNHLQIGGRFNHEHCKFPDGRSLPPNTVYEIYSKPELPRIPTLPMSCVTLLDILVRQFCLSDFEALIQSGEWQRSIRAVEQTWLKEHAVRLNEFLRQEEGDPAYVHQCRTVV